MTDIEKYDHVRYMIETGDWRLEELSLELSNECLVRCIHCSSGAQPKKVKGELTFEEHQRVMREAIELGATTLSLSGGDPILNPGLVEYVTYATTIGFERVLLYTTGIWRTKLDYIDCRSGVPFNEGEWDWEVDHWGLSGIRTFPGLGGLLYQCSDELIFIFSLHSHDASTNDYIMRMPGAFRMIMAGIEHLTKAGVEVWTHFVPMRPNIMHISKTRDLCVELGVSKMSLLRFVPQTRGSANYARLLPSLKMHDAIQQAIDYELTHPDRRDLPTAVRAGCPMDFRHASRHTSIAQAGTGKPKSCHAGTDLMLVRPTGTVHPCAAWKSLPQDGNVRQQSLKEIWESDATYNAIRHYLQEGYKELTGACESCESLESCRGGCPAQRLHAFGRRIEDLYYPEADPLCPTRLYDPVKHNCAR